MALSPALTMPGTFIDQRPRAPFDRRVRQRRYVLTGALLGALVAIPARIWMRTISGDPTFTWAGTTFIVLTFGALGACAGLAFSWRRLGSTRRLLVQRLAAAVPFLLMGPFMVIFLPGLVAAMVLAHPAWRRAVRLVACAFAGAALAFLLLAFLGSGASGVLSAFLYGMLAYALFLTNRIALEPRTAAGSELASTSDDPYAPWLGDGQPA